MEHSIVLLITPITIFVLLLSILGDNTRLTGIPTLTVVGILFLLTGVAIQLSVAVAYTLNFPRLYIAPLWVFKDIGLFLCCLSALITNMSEDRL